MMAGLAVRDPTLVDAERHVEQWHRRVIGPELPDWPNHHVDVLIAFSRCSEGSLEGLKR